MEAAGPQICLLTGGVALLWNRYQNGIQNLFSPSIKIREIETQKHAQNQKERTLQANTNERYQPNEALLVFSDFDYAGCTLQSGAGKTLSPDFVKRDGSVTSRTRNVWRPCFS